MSDRHPRDGPAASAVARPFHLALRVHDLAAAGRFYSGLLGALEVETTGSGLPPVPAMRRNG